MTRAQGAGSSTGVKCGLHDRLQRLTMAFGREGAAVFDGGDGKGSCYAG